MTRIGVLALQGDFREHRQMLERMGIPVVEVRKPEHLAKIEGLIIPGGESTTIGKLLVAYDLLQPLRERIAAGWPVWGTCAGAILLAKDIGGLDQPLLATMDIVVRRNAFGRQIESFEVDLDVPRLGPPPVRAIFIRAPRIIAAGPGVEVLARLDGETIAAARQGRLLATAFHPELTPDTRFHRYFVEQVVGGAAER